MAHKIAATISAEQLQKDLEKFRQRAIELGATDARIISADMVVVDEKVLAKCMYPKCGGYGTSANCPPHAMSPDLTRKVVNNFRNGIFIKTEVPSEIMADPEARDRRQTWQRKMQEIVARIEAEAFYDGYHLALGFAMGSCKSIFCPDIECSALVPGQACRHHHKSRSSMEAAGMDAFTMAARVGWDIYPIGASSTPSDVPYGVLLGLVLIY